jgi:hypothetical protein
VPAHVLLALGIPHQLGCITIRIPPKSLERGSGLVWTFLMTVVYSVFVASEIGELLARKGERSSGVCEVFREIGVMNILITPEGQPVFWDGKGNFSLEKNDDFYMAAHFQKVLPGDDPETFRQKAAEQLGIDVQYEEY